MHDLDRRLELSAEAKKCPGLARRAAYLAEERKMLHILEEL